MVLFLQKRREKINERLKTLQNLVPNGTKVDISTLLEEAVNYVKFLQLQIKVCKLILAVRVLYLLEPTFIYTVKSMLELHKLQYTL